MCLSRDTLLKFFVCCQILAFSVLSLSRLFARCVYVQVLIEHYFVFFSIMDKLDQARTLIDRHCEHICQGTSGSRSAGFLTVGRPFK